MSWFKIKQKNQRSLVYILLMTSSMEDCDSSIMACNDLYLALRQMGHSWNDPNYQPDWYQIIMFILPMINSEDIHVLSILCTFIACRTRACLSASDFFKGWSGPYWGSSRRSASVTTTSPSWALNKSWLISRVMVWQLEENTKE